MSEKKNIPVTCENCHTPYVIEEEEYKCPLCGVDAMRIKIEDSSYTFVEFCDNKEDVILRNPYGICEMWLTEKDYPGLRDVIVINGIGYKYSFSLLP